MIHHLKITKKTGKGYKKGSRKVSKSFPKKKKSGNMVASDIKTFPSMKSKGWLSIEKNILKS